LAKAQTSLSIGDISIVGFNSNGADNFSFVMWKDVVAGTVIKFTDNGFLSSAPAAQAGNARGGESFVLWTSTQSTPAGTVIKIEGLSASLGVASAGSSSGLGGISNEGDQLFVYQGVGTGANPDFASNATSTTFSGRPLFLLNFKSAFASGSSVASTNLTFLPSDLNVTNGYINFPASTVVAAHYTGLRSGQASLADYRTRVNDPSNWSTSSGSAIITLDLTAFSVVAGPAITTQPNAQTVTASESATFSVIATGTPAPTYQWRKAGVALTGNATATTATLILNNVTPSDAGTYEVVVTNSAGTVTSTSAALTVNPPAVAPLITTQPNAQTVTASENATFSVIATGTPAPTYQWRKAGVALTENATATTTTLILNNVAPSDAGTYDVVVTNSAGTVTSTSAALTVNPATSGVSTLVWDFSTATPLEGMLVSFSGGTLIQGNNNGTTTLLTTVSASSTYAGASGANNGGMAARTGGIKQGAGGSAYFEFTLTPAAGYQITATALRFGSRSTSTGPAAYAFYTSEDNFFAPAAAGALKTNSTWALQTPAFTPIIGATGMPLTFRLYGFNGVGSAAAGSSNWRIDDLKLTIDVALGPDVAPTITTQPAAQSVTAGESAAFTVNATGTPAPTYQWRKAGVVINGNATSTTADLILNNVTTSDAGAYDVVVANSAGSVTSHAATLTVNPQAVAPVITTQPAARTVTAGENAVFTVNATGTPAPAYQWRKSGVTLTDNASASTATLMLTSVTSYDAGDYDVVVTNAAGAVTSASATLAVDPVRTGVAPLIWDFSTAAPAAGLPVTVTGGSLTQGNNYGTTTLLSAVSASSGYRGATGVNNAAAVARVGAFNPGTDGSAYFEFTLTPSEGYQLSATALSFGSRSTSTGPAAYALYTSVDDFTAPIATGVLAANSVWSLQAPAFNAVTALTGTSITFRLYGYNGVGSSASGSVNWRIDDLKLTLGVIVGPDVAPTITAQPSAQIVTTGQSATFRVIATGTPAPTYQWRKAAVAITGNATATTAALTLPSVTANDAGAYDVVVTNAAGAVTSASATLSVNPAWVAPMITTQPIGQTVTVGERVTFSVIATGTPAPTYQWRKAGVALTDNASATTATLTLTRVSSYDVGTYDVVVTNAAGIATSTAISLAVNPVGTGTGTLIWDFSSAVPASGLPTTVTSSSLTLFNSNGTTELLSAAAVSSGYAGATAAGNAAASARIGALNAGLNGSAYFEFTLTPAAGYQITASALSFGSRSTSTGPAAYALLSSVDNYNVPIATGFLMTNSTWSLQTPLFSPVSGRTSLPIIFRLYGYDGAGSVASGSVNWRIDDLKLTLNVAIGPAVAPEITTSPKAQTVTAGTTATFSVTATGWPEPTYQWRKAGVALTDNATATTAALTLPSVTANDAGAYDVVVTNAAGTVTSASATLTVNPIPVAPIITTAPTERTATVGETVTFNVIATGTPTPTYQWRQDGVAILGNPSATTATLSLGRLTSTEAGSYDVLVTNLAGAATSTAATLTVHPLPVAPTINTQPTALSILVGSTTRFTVIATGTPAPTYQWRKSGVPLLGNSSSTTATLLLDNITASDAGSYDVVVSNSAGVITSAPARLTVNPASATVQINALNATYDGAPHAVIVNTSPAGLTANITYNGTSTPPTAAGSYVVVATITDANYSGRATGTLVLAKAAQTLDFAPPDSLLKVGVPLSLRATASSGLPVIFSLVSGRATLDATNLTPSSTESVVVRATQHGDANYHPVHAELTLSATPHNQTITFAPLVDRTTNAAPQTLSATATSGLDVNFTLIAGPATLAGRTLTLDGTPGLVTVRASQVGNARYRPASEIERTFNVIANPTAPTISRQPTAQMALVGGAATFTVTATGIPAPTYQWYHNGRALAGNASSTTQILILNSLQAVDAGAYEVTVSNASGRATSSLALLTVTAGAVAPEITLQPANSVATVGGTATFSVAATGVPTPAYQWRRDDVILPGENAPTLILTDVRAPQAGHYTAVITNAAGVVTSRAAALRVNQRSFAGAYFGYFGGNLGSCSFFIRDDNTGVFLGFNSGSGAGYFARELHVDTEGRFTFSATTVARPPFSDEMLFSGHIGPDFALSGSVDGMLFAAKRASENSTASFAGYYEAGVGDSLDLLRCIISPAGDVFVLSDSAAGVDGGKGVVTLDGQIRVITSRGQSLMGTLAPSTLHLSATLTDLQAETIIFSGAEKKSPAASEQRLVNLSSRVWAGPAEEVAVAGFVISGEQAKPVLIRAAGPALAQFGLAASLASPQLDVYREGVHIASNAGWSTATNSAALAAATSRAGAFAFPHGSRDAALLQTLPPGAYTVNLSATSGPAGLALIEIYDLSGVAPGQKLTNLSSRAKTGRGTENLIAGVVVSGMAPKRVLIRAAGPALAAFGLPEVLRRPQLTLHVGAAVIARNDSWSTSANSAAIAQATAQAGAFAFAPGSADAALLVNLSPGTYTAQVSCLDGSSGVALIEIYEVP
jgi:hypothetical protein